MNRVGVSLEPYDPAAYKRHALLFDRIAYPYLEHSLSNGGIASDPLLRSEVEWLISRGFLFDPVESFTWPFELSGGAAGPLNRFSSATSKLRSIREERGNDGLWTAEQVSLAAAARSDLARAFAVLVKDQLKVDAVALIDPADVSEDLVPCYESASSDRTTEVTHIAIDALPVPAESVSWEDLLEFCADPRVQAAQNELRAWLRQVARQGVSTEDVARELESKTNRYREHMKQHRIEIGNAMLETLAWSAVGAAGANLSSTLAVLAAVGVGLTVRRRRAQLLREEMLAPGAEVALVVKARERFNRP